MRTITRIALVLSVALASCSSPEPEAGHTGAALYVIPGRCPSSALLLYDQNNFTGNRLCYGGTGTTGLPSGWLGHVRSFKSGLYGVTFHTPSSASEETWCPGENVAVASPIVEDAWSLTRHATILDAGACE